MENNYKYFAFKYIYEKIGLNQVESELITNGIKYLDYQDEEDSLYRTISKFFNLKNNIDISLLSEEELEMFKKYFSIPIEEVLNNNALLNEIYSFILKTIPKVLFPKVEENHCYYGPLNINYIAPRDSIVLGFNYYEFDIEENFDEVYDKQQQIICDALNNIQFNLSSSLEYVVSVIKYNEFYEKKTNQLKQ